MNAKQERKFKSLCRQMRDLLAEMEPDHPDIQVFIHDGAVYLMDWPSGEPPLGHILTDGGMWHRSGGGGF